MRITENRLRRVIRSVINEMFDSDDIQTIDNEIGNHLSDGKLLTNKEFQEALDYLRRFRDDVEVKKASYSLMRLAMAPEANLTEKTFSAIESVLKKALGEERGDLSLWVDYEALAHGDNIRSAVDTLINLYNALDKSSGSHSQNSTFSDASFYPRRTFGGPNKRNK